MVKFRTHQEMEAVYDRFEQADQPCYPYIVEASNDKQKILFFGVKHTADPADEQWQDLDRCWQEFIGSANPKKQVFSEGGLRDIAGKTREQAIISDAESGLMCWLAEHHGIEISSPEPGRAEEISYLLEKCFAPKQIMLYYFARQMVQWNAYDHKTNPDWLKYAANTVEKYSQVHEWQGHKFMLEDMLTAYEQATGKLFSETDRQSFYALSAPTDSAVSAASGRYRDELLFAAIKQKWQAGYDIFTVYGSGHAIVLEPAIKELCSA